MLTKHMGAYYCGGLSCRSRVVYWCVIRFRQSWWLHDDGCDVLNCHTSVFSQLLKYDAREIKSHTLHELIHSTVTGKLILRISQTMWYQARINHGRLWSVFNTRYNRVNVNKNASANCSVCGNIGILNITSSILVLHLDLKRTRHQNLHKSKFHQG